MSKHKRQVPGVHPYDGPAGGWGALKATAIAVRNEMETVKAPATLLRTNQPDGFDCPGCAWPDKAHGSTFQFCENGAKAVTWEATSKRVTPAFFSENTVAGLLKKTDHQLEGFGRLTAPLRYDADSDKYCEVSWDDAFAEIASTLNRLQPQEVEFYTSGRASNEAAWLFQLFARQYGSNNFPDCSNMCHEPTSVGLPQSIGIGKGTVQLDDFDRTELLISIGHNPGTNHPRMMGTLHELSRRNVPIIVFNPMRERALERFADPQNVVEMATYGATEIASTYYLVKAGGDAAALKGIAKAVIALDAATGAAVDRAFIAQHTEGYENFVADVQLTRWETIEAESGLTREQLEEVGRAYVKSQATIITYGMGITQHPRGTENVRLIANLLLMRGNIGKPGAGICPLRGHSNVQGNRTVGITEKPSAAFLDKLQAVCGFSPPREPGHDVVKAMESAIGGRSKALICLGGNLAVAMPDPTRCFPAFKALELSVHIGTKLNRSHLLTGRQSFILPCLGRTERDVQAEGEQSVTVEDSMSMVHASSGKLKPASPLLRSEPAIIAGMAEATLPDSPTEWKRLIANYDRIRDLIEQTVSGFDRYNQRIRQPGGFQMPLPPRDRQWPTPSGKAVFSVYPGVEEDPPADGENVLRLITLRSHDQYNTTIYGLDDRYRGIFGRRDVLFMNEQDMLEMNIEHGDVVNLDTALPGHSLRLEGITVVAYAIARGTVGAYYPESNVLIPLDYIDPQSGTPAYKSVPVRVCPI